MSGRGYLVGVLVAWCASPLAAQSTSIILTGLVTSRTDGVPVPAVVEVRSRETGAIRSAQAGVDGVYRVLGLTPGPHDISVRALGYRAQRRLAVELVLGARPRVDFALELEVAALEPSLIVATPTVEVERLDVSTPVLRREIERLPLSARNVLGVAAIAPGIRSYGGIPTAGALSTARMVNFYVDGDEWKSMSTGQVVGQPQTGSLLPMEGIREFRVYQNPYDAEFTRGASWVISAVTEQGTNELHGSFFGFGQDRGLVAQGSFQPDKPAYERSQLGLNLRGPLIRDRLFAAVSYERQATDNFLDVVPGRPKAVPGIWDQYAGTFPAPLRNQMAMIHLTGLAGAHTVDATWIARELHNESGFGVPQNGTMLSHEAGTVSDYAVTSARLRDRYVSSSFVNELALRVLHVDQDDSPLQPGPSRRYPGLQFGRTAYPVGSTERHITLSDRISLTRRVRGVEHIFKSGIELTRLRGNAYQPTSMDGFFLFASDTSSLPTSAQIGLGYRDPTSTDGARADRRSWLLGAYLQDQWHPVPSVTLLTGLRYDAEINTLNQSQVAPWSADTTLRRVVGDRYLNSGDRVNDMNNLAPRVALAWDVTGKGVTSLRAGFGVMYDRVPVFGAFSEQIAWDWRTYVIQNPGTTDAAELRRRLIAAGPNSAPNLVLLPDRLDAPATRQWSLGLGRRLSERSALNVDYVDQRMTHLPVTVRANTVNAATRQRRLTSKYSDLLLWGDFGDARARAVLTSLTYDREPVRLNVAYTLSWAESEVGAVSTSDYPDSASYSMQQSDADERHRLVLSALTTLPRSVELSVLAVLSSPRPYAVFVGTDVNQDGLLTDDWPGGMRTARHAGLEHWYRVIDVRLGKRFEAASGRFILTADVFNLFNWGNHSEYQGVQSQLGYGDAIGDHPRRQGQLGLRYDF